MTTDDHSEVYSDLAIPSGETLADEIAARRMRQTELTGRLERPMQGVTRSFAGRGPSPRTRPSAWRRFWTTRQRSGSTWSYRMTGARVREHERLQAEEQFAQGTTEVESKASAPTEVTGYDLKSSNSA